MSAKEPMPIEKFLKTPSGKMLTKLAYTREERLIEAAADEAGFPFERVKRVYDLMNELDKVSLGELGLKVINGKVTVDFHPGCSGEPDEIKLPQSLWDRIDNLDFDIVELLHPIHRAWQAEYGFPYPTLFSTVKITDGMIHIPVL